MLGAAAVADGWRRLEAAAAEQQGRALLALPLLLALGIGGYFALPAEPDLATVLAPFGLGLALVGLTGRWRMLLLVSLALTTVAAGVLLAKLRSDAVAAPVLERRLGPLPVEGRVVEVQLRDSGWRLVLDQVAIERLAPAATPVRVRLTHRLDPPPVGGRVVLRAVLLPPPGPAAPGAFDFARQAWFERLGAVGYTMGQPRLLDRPPGSWRIALADLRQRLATRIRAALPGDAGALAAALMTGDRGAISQQTLDAMRDSGLAHLLAISGLHIGLFSGVVFFGVRGGLALWPAVALRWPIKKWAAVAALLAAGGYMALTGASVPTQRAFIMVALVLLAILVDRNALSMRLVAVAATLVLFIAPESLLSVSFQMSFAAVVALIAAYEAARPRLSAWRRLGTWWARPTLYVAGVLLSTLVAGLATAPFALFHFNQTALYSLAANLVAVPATALWIMPMAVVTFLAMPLGWEVGPLRLMQGGLAAVIESARTVADWPGAVLRLPASPMAALLLVVAAGLWLCLLQGRGRWLALPGLALGLALFGSAPRPEVLVDDIAGLVAVRAADGLAFSRTARGFTVESWLRRAGLPPDGRSLAAWRCDRAACVFPVGTPLAAHVRSERALAEDCALVQVLVSAEPVRVACPAPVVIDRFDVWRHGPHAVYRSGDGWRVETVAARRGRRPWVPGR